MYAYTENNLLENPHSYMYTTYHGDVFLQSYLSDRRSSIKQYTGEDKSNYGNDQTLVQCGKTMLDKLFEVKTIDTGKRFPDIFANNKVDDPGLNLDAETDTRGLLHNMMSPLSAMSITQNISTLDLLYALNAALLVGEPDSNIKYWLDKLVQRYEVTKKIYQVYQPGFRKGNGSANSIKLYWLLSLLLALFYAKTYELKYLSTLLKTNDLLCSISGELVLDKIPVTGIKLVLAAELFSVYLLNRRLGIPFEIV
jgi:hypothetical protein